MAGTAAAVNVARRSSVARDAFVRRLAAFLLLHPTI